MNEDIQLPTPLPDDINMHTIREYVLDPKQEMQVVGIPDGWRPLCVRPLEHSLILVTLQNTENPPCGEVFLILHPGFDMEKYQSEMGCELHFLGSTFHGGYLFLQIPALGHPSKRRIGRDDIQEIG